MWPFQTGACTTCQPGSGAHALFFCFVILAVSSHTIVANDHYSFARPKWVRAKNGSVTHLLTGAASRDMHDGKTFTFAQRILS